MAKIIINPQTEDLAHGFIEEIMKIAERCAAYPTLDERPADEILAEQFEDAGGH